MADNMMEFLMNHFPHRWLDKRKAGTLKLFSGLGNTLDYIETYTDVLKRNNSTRTATELLAELENEYGLAVNPSYDFEVRRANILAAKRATDFPITKQALWDMMHFMGIKAEITADYAASTMRVVMEPVADTKEVLLRGRELLLDNVRAHVWLDMVGILKESYDVPVAVESFLVFSSDYFARKNIRRRLLDGGCLLDGSSFLDSEYEGQRLLNGGWTLNGSGLLDGKHEGQLFLDSSCFLDGVYNLKGYINNYDTELYPASLTVNSDMAQTVAIETFLTIEKDLYYLDGTGTLDGGKLLDAEVIEMNL